MGKRLPHNVCGAVVVVAFVVVVFDVVDGLDVDVLPVSVVVSIVVGARVVVRTVESVAGREVERRAGKAGPAGLS